MKKRKINKRVLLVVLAFAVLASLFAVSASALTPEEADLCDCIMSQSFLFSKADLEKHHADGDTISLTCAECHREYVFYLRLEHYLAYSEDFETIKFTFFLETGDQLYLRGRWIGAYKTIKVNAVSVNDVVVPSLDVDSACDCIYSEGACVSYETMLEHKANNEPIVCYCSSCLIEYSFTIDWSQFPSNECDGYDIFLETYENGNNLVISIVEDNNDVRVFNTALQAVSASKGNRYSVGQMVGTMTQGVGGILVGVGNSIVGFFDNVVLDDNGNLTTFATWALTFFGLAFGLGVVKFITYLVKK